MKSKSILIALAALCGAPAALAQQPGLSVHTAGPTRVYRVRAIPAPESPPDHLGVRTCSPSRYQVAPGQRLTREQVKHNLRMTNWEKAQARAEREAVRAAVRQAWQDSASP